MLPFKIMYVEGLKQTFPHLPLRTHKKKQQYQGECGRGRDGETVRTNVEELLPWFILILLKYSEVTDACAYRIWETSVQTSWMHRDMLQCQRGIRKRQPDMTYGVLWMHFKKNWWECFQQGYAIRHGCLLCSSQCPNVIGWYFSLLALFYFTEHAHTFQVKSAPTTSFLYPLLPLTFRHSSSALKTGMK